MKILLPRSKVSISRAKTTTNHLSGGAIMQAYPFKGGNIAMLKERLAGMAIDKPKKVHRIKF